VYYKKDGGLEDNNLLWPLN